VIARAHSSASLGNQRKRRDPLGGTEGYQTLGAHSLNLTGEKGENGVAQSTGGQRPRGC
jgi:hypothetical protein